MRHTPLLHGIFHGPIWQYWLHNDVSDEPVVQRYKVIFIIIIILVYQSELQQILYRQFNSRPHDTHIYLHHLYIYLYIYIIRRCRFRNRHSERHLHDVLQRHNILSTHVPGNVTQEYFALGGLRQSMEYLRMPQGTVYMYICIFINRRFHVTQYIPTTYYYNILSAGFSIFYCVSDDGEDGMWFE